MRQLDPQYRLVFEGSESIDATPDMARMEAEIARLCPADARGLRPFLAENRRKLEAFRPVLERAFCSPADVLGLDMLRSLRLMRPHRTVDQDLAKHFRDPRVRLAFSFQTKYLGMSPFRCPSLFTILSFLEYEHGVFHPIGGCGAVSDAMARAAARIGVDIRLESPVERIAFAGRRAIGVEVGGRHHAADAVVVNADFAHAIPRLIPDALRRRWTDRKIGRARYSCSTFMLYLGVEGEFPDLPHHSILLAEDYRRNIRQIETRRDPGRAEPLRAARRRDRCLAWRRPATPASTCWCRCRTCCTARTGPSRRRATGGWRSTGCGASASPTSRAASVSNGW